MKIVEDRPTPQVIAHAIRNIFAHGLKQRMPRGNPFQRRVVRQQSFVEDDLLVIAPELAESAFQPFANRRQGARNFADAVDVTIFLHRAGIDSSDWRRRCKEILDNLRDEPPLACLGRLADNGPRFNSRLARPSRVESVILRKRSASTSRTMRASMLGRSVRLAYISRNSFSSRFDGKDFANHVEHMVCAQLVANFR